MLSLLFSAPLSAQTAESFRQRAIELSRMKSWDEAISSYRKALALEPNDASTHYNLALALKYKGDAKRAAEEFEAALQLKPKWADAHYGLGATWYDLSDQAAALKELRTAVEFDPTNVAAHRLLARIYSRQGYPSAADGELLRAAPAITPAHLHFELGLTEEQLGNLDSAAAEFRRALPLNPRLPPAPLMLCGTLPP